MENNWDHFQNKSVVAALPQSDEMVLCIIRDFIDSNGGTTKKHTLNLQASIPAQDAARDITDLCGYQKNTISVHYETTLGGNPIILEQQDSTVTLGHVCSSGAKRHNFSLQEMEDVTPVKKVDQETGTQLVDLNLVYSSDVISWTPQVSKSTEDISYSSSLIKSDTGYLGLVNQAMTCYLNSLLQTLYMTPEFRNAIYSWKFDGSEDESIKSIPYQLQRLFLQLQTSNKKAVETTDLTRSFGWDSSEVWQQHDVQELCRVMFDALEQNWKNTVQANVINQLYQGKLKDYVKCLECGYESARTDAYLDIPLVIRPFGSTETYESVHQAMNAFVQPEILDESNQYFCEKCNKKCNAHKGLKFESFPYLLTLQLKRFDFDYSTMHRIKLNDKVTFPEVLDLNSFVTVPSRDTDDDVSAKTNIPMAHVDSSDEGIDEGIEIETACSAASSSSDSSSISLDATVNNTRNTFYSGCKGPYVYELFSIMIHSGSAAGGHYYAYIKSFNDGEWYSFNDQHVTKITYDDIRKTYGGSNVSSGFYTSTYTSSTSAYMLMYRQIDKEVNADVMQPEDFPEFLKAELKQQKDKEEAERRQREIDKSTCKIKLYCFHPEDQRKLETKLEIHKDKTLMEATEMSRKQLELESVVSLDCCRLVKYDEYQDSLECSFEGKEDTCISSLLGGVKANYTFDLLLETKRPNQKFLVYKPGGVTVKVHVVNIETGVISPPVNVRAYHVQTVGEFKNLLEQILELPASNMRCVIERYQNELRLLNDPFRTLKAEGFYKSNKVFVDCSDDINENELPYNETRLSQLLDQHQHTINVTCHLPSNINVKDYLTSLKESQSSEATRSRSLPTYEQAIAASSALSTTSSQHDEVTSEIDSAFYSADTNSKHSLCVDQGSNFSISSVAALESQYPLAGTALYVLSQSQLTRGDNVDTESARLPEDSHKTLTCNASDNQSMEGKNSRLQASASQENLTLDVADLKSRLQSVTLQSSHSDPSLYASCVENSDPGMHYLGSGHSSPSQDEARPDPEPILSSPEDGYGFEDEVDPKTPDMDHTGFGLISPVFNDEHPRNTTDDTEFAWDQGLPTSHSISFRSYPSSSSLPQITGETEITDKWESSQNESTNKVEETDFTKTGLKHPPEPPPLPPPPTSISNRRPNSTKPVTSNTTEDQSEEIKRYFRASMSAFTDSSERVLNVSVDKRITLGAFKKELEPYVGVASNLFKVYRVYSNNQQFESVRLSDTLSYFEDGKFNIKLGRALQPGEHRVKVFQLDVNDVELCKFLIETIFAKGMSVLQSKFLILQEIKEQCNLDIPLDRCRLRKKSWTNPGTVYIDSQIYEKEIPIYPNWEIFVEILNEADDLTDTSQLAVYLRRWHPSTHTIERFQEIVLKHRTVDELKSKISSLSGIPVADVEFAKGKGTFPCEISLLEIHTDLEWNPQVINLNMWPLYICDDGHVIYYRDKKETLVELSEDKKKEIQQKENRNSNRTSKLCSPRKERALKIYTDENDKEPSSSEQSNFFVGCTLLI